jgi:hypothetical protein
MRFTKILKEPDDQNHELYLVFVLFLDFDYNFNIAIELEVC